MLQHAEKPDGVADEKIALVLWREVRATQDAAGRHRPNAFLVELFWRAHAPANAHVTAGARGAVGGILESPAVKGVAVRVRANGEMKLNFKRARVESVHATTRRAKGLRWRLHVCHVKHAA